MIDNTRHVNGHGNVLKRLLVHDRAFILGLWLKTLFGNDTPRALQGRLVAFVTVFAELSNLTLDAIGGAGVGTSL